MLKFITANFSSRHLLWLFLLFIAPIIFVAAVLPTLHVDVRRLTSLAADFPLLGTARHPPLSTWLTWAASRLPFFDTWVAVAFQAVLNLGAIWFFWAIGRRFLGKDQQSLLISILLVSIVMTAWSVPGYSLNEDVAQIPIWAGALYFYFRSADAPHKIGNWLGLGALLALAILTKYYAVFLILALILSSIFVGDLRRHWKTKGPWLAILVVLVLSAPHFIWLAGKTAEMGFLQQKLAPSGVSLGQKIQNLFAAIAFPAILALPGLAVVLPVFIRRKFALHDRAQKRDIALLGIVLGFLLLGTSLLSVSGTAFVGRYQTPLAGIAILFLVAFVPNDVAARLKPKVIGSAIVFWALIYGASAGVYLFGPGHGLAQEAGPALAKYVLAEWDKRYDCGPAVALGNQYDAGLFVAYAARPIHRVFLGDVDTQAQSKHKDVWQGGVVLISKTKSGQIGEMLDRFSPTPLSFAISLPLRRNLRGFKTRYDIGFVAPKACPK